MHVGGGRKIGWLTIAVLVARVAVGASPTPLPTPGDDGALLVVAEVVDTVSSLGPLATTPRTVTLDDLVRFHGHACDGLVVAAIGVGYGLRELFPDELRPDTLKRRCQP